MRIPLTFLLSLILVSTNGASSSRHQEFAHRERAPIRDRKAHLRSNRLDEYRDDLLQRGRGAKGPESVGTSSPGERANRVLIP